MVERPDVVLAAIPVLAVGGVLLERLLPAMVTTSAGVGGLLAALPLPVLGFLAALSVVGYALFWLPGVGTDS